MTDGPRPELLRAIEQALPGARLFPIAGDASSRRFYRVVSTGSTSVVMDYGRPIDGETDDQRLTRVFLGAGLPVPRVLDADPEVGYLRLDDLGERTLEAVYLAQWKLPGRGRALALLNDAARLAGRVAGRGTPALADSERADGPALDAARFRFEMDYFLEHYVVGLRGIAAPPAGLSAALHDLADRAARTPRQVLCHRDFHSRNLMVLADGSLAMVDIQDARFGPDTYDLASLAYDAYIDIEPSWRPELVAAFLAEGDEAPAPGFDERLRVVAIQRMVKALGTFGFQVHRLGRERYREAIPRTVTRLAGLVREDRSLTELATRLGAAGLLDPAAR